MFLEVPPLKRGRFYCVKPLVERLEILHVDTDTLKKVFNILESLLICTKKNLILESDHNIV